MFIKYWQRIAQDCAQYPSSLALSAAVARIDWLEIVVGSAQPLPAGGSMYGKLISTMAHRNDPERCESVMHRPITEYNG